MSLSLAPLASRIRQRLPGARSLETYSVESVVVQRSEDEPMRPAVYPAGELDRVRGVHEFSAGISNELHLATRDTVHHTETIGWRLHNVCVSQSRLCNLHSYRKLTFRASPSAPARVRDVPETVAFCSSAAGNDYFAHLLLDDASTALLGRNFGNVLLGGSPIARTAHTLDYLTLFGIDYADVGDAILRDAWVFTDHAQNRHRRERLRELRTALQDRFPDDSESPVYLRRGQSGSNRRLNNEAEVAAALERRGFIIVDPETLEASEICGLLRNTPLAVGVEGSHLVHGLLNMRDGGGLMCIQPAARFNAVYRGFCNSLGLEWGFVVAEGSAEQFSLPIDRLMRAIDLLAAQTGLPC